MKRVFLLSALFVMSILAGWAQAEQPTETGFGIIFSDGSTVKGELYAEEGDTAYALRDQVIAKEQSFKLYDFGTQTAWVTSQHAFLNEHISIQNDSYMPDSTAAYSIAIWKDSLIIALPSDMPEPNGTYSGTRGGKQLGAVSENGFTFLIYTDYSYYYNSNKTETVNFPNETIAICTACTKRQDIIIPSSVTWNGVSYPVKVIGDNAELKPLYDDRGKGHPQCLTIPASVEVLEYNTFGHLESATTRLIVEDTNVRLLCSPSRMGLGWLEGGGRRGIFAKLHYLEDAYIGRDLKNATTDKDFEPFFTWPYFKEYGGHGENLSITFGHHVKSLSAGYFGNFLGKKLTLTFEQLGIVDCENAWPGKDMNVSCNMRVYAGYGNEYKLKDFYHKQRNDINISDLPGSGTSGGTKWELVAIGSIKDGTCTGYRMTVSPSGNGKMEDKNNANEYGWFEHHKVITELDIESGVTHLSKLGWDGYPLEAIYVRTQDAKSLPAIGADAFRGVNKKTPVYVHSSIRTILQNQADWKACFKDFRDLDIQDFIKPYVDWIKNVVGNAKDDATKNLAENYIKNANGIVRREQIDAAKIEFLHQLFNQDGDGTITSPYAIATADQLMCFANLTSMDHYLSACGKLTADINAETYGADVMLAKNQERAYMGTLDGQGHSINIGFASVTNAALIGTLGGTVKNLIVTGGLQLATATDANSLGGVVACCFNTATVENCISKVTLTGTTSYNSCGGIVGKTLGRDPTVGTATIRNCAFLGQIIFDNSGAPKGVAYCGGIVGRSEGVTLVSHCYTAATYRGEFSDNCANIAQIGTEGVAPKIERCYYLTALGSSKQGKALDEQQRTTGQWCYLLNDSVSDGAQAWYQKVNEDGYPYPFSRGGDVVYWNNGSYTNTHTTHTFGADGFCTICGAVNPNQQVYKVSTAGQWKHLAAYVDKDHCKFNVELMKDINLTCIGNAAMVGKRDLAYRGTFDGQGHTLTINIAGDTVGLFRAVHSGTIRNLSVEGKVTTGTMYAGGIVGDAYWETKLENCISEVTITCTKEGEGNCGGLIGICNNPTLINCAFAGEMVGNNTSCWGGLVGLEYMEPTITNCYVAAQAVNISPDGCCTFARITKNREPKMTNCYYVTPLGNTQGGIRVSAVDAKRGKMCYDLNKGITDGSQAWYQALQSEQPEDHPYPFSQGGDTVYLSDDGKNYSNTKPKHDYGPNGFCKHCNAVNPACTSFTISTIEQFRTWAEWVNDGHGSVDAKLDADFNFDQGLPFTIGIGNVYTGVFNGQGHKVSMRLGEKMEAPMWGLFGGTMKNVYFQITISPMQVRNFSNSYALINECPKRRRSQILNCVFSISWELIGDRFPLRQCLLGGLINTVYSIRFFNCAFLGSIDYKMKNNLCIYGLFLRDVIGDNILMQKCYEDVVYKGNMQYVPFIPYAARPAQDCHTFNFKDVNQLPSNLVDNLNSRQYQQWLWVKDQGIFGQIAVPFKQCGIHWNGGEGGEDALPQILAPAQRANKYMEDGRIVIQRGNTYYDIFGKEL